MKAFLPVTILLLTLTACSNSGGGGGNRGGSGPVVEKPAPFEVAADFELSEGVNDVSANSYVPRITYALKTPLDLSLVPAGRDVALILTDKLPNADGELSKIIGQLLGEKFYGTKESPKNRVEKLNADTWRIVLDRTMIDEMQSEARANVKYIMLNYSIPNTDLAAVFPRKMGLAPSYATEDAHIAIGHVLIPIGTPMTPYYAAEQAANEEYFREKILGRTILGYDRVTVNGQRIEIGATVNVEQNQKCSVRYSSARILSEDRFSTATQTDIENKLEVPCAILGDYLVLKNVGRLSLSRGSSTNGSVTHGIYLKRELFAKDKLGVLTKFGEGRDVYVPGKLYYTN